MSSQARTECYLLQMSTSVPRPCTTAAPASSATTCLVPTSAPAPMATARSGLNVWVSPGAASPVPILCPWPGSHPSS